MSKTKEKILNTSLLLFNEYGLSKITLRRIALEMGISQGNLNYHFKKREDIVEQLYQQLVQNIDANIQQINPLHLSIKTIYSITHNIAFQFYEFRFFLLDFTQIMREHEAIRAHYQELSNIRKSQMMFIWTQLVFKKLIRPEAFTQEYENLYTRIQIMSDFWMSSHSIQKGTITKKQTTAYVKIIFENIYPYLTVLGHDQYQNINL